VSKDTAARRASSAATRHRRDCDGLLRVEVRCSDVFFSDKGSCRHPVHPTRRGRPRRPLAITKFGTIWQGYAQLIYHYNSNDKWAMPDQDNEDFRFPCRFPAKPSIIAEPHEQVYDLTGVFCIGKPPEKFSRVFPVRQGTGKGGVATSAQYRGGVAAVSAAKARSRRVSSRYSLRRSGGAGFERTHSAPAQLSGVGAHLSANRPLRRLGQIVPRLCCGKPERIRAGASSATENHVPKPWSKACSTMAPETMVESAFNHAGCPMQTYGERIRPRERTRGRTPSR
jgi:hypothetical protein